MKYIYGFIEAGGKTDFGHIGLENGEPVRALPYDGLAAVISETSSRAMSSLPREQLAGRLARHQAVVETVMKADHTVLPMKFGTALDNEAQVTELLRRNRQKLQALLDDIEKLFEVEVIATWPDIQEVFAQIAGEEDIVQLKQRIAGLSAEESTAERLRLGKMVKGRLDARKQALQERLLPPWEEVAHSSVLHEIRNDSVVVNAGLLVDETALGRLVVQVRDADRQEGESLDFRIVGPLPPYSFSTVQVHRARLSELEQARHELGLPEHISPEQIADAARSAMRRFHPDAAPRDKHMPQKFERTKAAADMLGRFCPPRGLDLTDCGSDELLLIERREEL